MIFLSRMRQITTVLMLILLGGVATGAEQRPNFIIFIADDMAYNDSGAYGHPHIKTPNIDLLARNGMRFDNAYLTTSSCSPSRCSILTGLYPHATGAPELHMPLSGKQVLFPGLLGKAGYHTVSAGKWHLGNEVKKQFDIVDEVGGDSGCEKWVDYLRNRPKGKPFFFWFAAKDPHRSYKKDAIKFPHKPTDVIVPPYLPDVHAVREDLAMYYDEISRLDSYVGDVLTELKREGLDDNTFVLFMSDNGRPFPRCKTTLTMDGVRTPFIVKYPPLVDPGNTCDSLVSVIDIAPTILQLAGLQPGDRFQGLSFKKLLTNPFTSIRQYAYSEHNWHDYRAYERAVHTKTHTYIRNWLPELARTPPADAVTSMTYHAMLELEAGHMLSPYQRDCFVKPRAAEELYDSKADPHSLMNLAGTRNHAITLEQMQYLLDIWREDFQDIEPVDLTPDGFDRTTGKRLANNLKNGQIQQSKKKQN